MPALPPNVVLHTLDDLDGSRLQPLLKKYRSDELRWSLKPVYLRHLLDSGFEKAIYCDNDIYFFGEPGFLFEQLNHASFLLTPHFYPSDPRKGQNWLEANFRVGLYNAGFVGASQSGVAHLDWWAACCAYEMRKSFWRGLYDDQKYLDLVPIRFEGVGVVKHKGCNLAGWNYSTYEIERTATGIELNGDPLVFVHFAALSMELFSVPGSILHPEYQRYEAALRKYKPGFRFVKNKWGKNAVKPYFYYLRWLLARKINI